MKVPMAQWSAACMLGLALSACGDPVELVCTEELRPGIIVDVLEEGTGLPAADGATLTVHDGDYDESSTEAYEGRTMAGAWERAGTYDVAVAKPGYHTWVRTGVVVRADECHVITVHLEVGLRSSTTALGAVAAP